MAAVKILLHGSQFILEGKSVWMASLE